MADNTLLELQQRQLELLKSLHEPWSFKSDYNGDNATTISDVGSALAQVFFLPGDSILWWLWGTGLGNFLEISASSLGGVLSGVLSFCLWILLFGFLGAVGE